MKQLFALMKGYSNNIPNNVGKNKKLETKEDKNSKKSLLNKFLKLKGMKGLFNTIMLFILAIIIVSSIITPFIKLINDNNLDILAIRNIVISTYTNLVIVMLLFFSLFLVISNSININKTEIFNIYPVSNLKKYFAQILVTMESTVKIGLTILIISLLNITIRTNLSFDFISLLVGTAVTLIIPIPIIVLISVVSKLIVTILSKIVSKKNLEKIFTLISTFLGLVIYVIFSARIITFDEFIKNTPIINSISKILNENIQKILEYSNTNKFLELFGLFIVFAIVTSIIVYIASIIDRILDNILQTASNTSGIFSKSLNEEEIKERSEKELTNHKIKSLEKTYIQKELREYTRSIQLLMSQILPIAILPILFLLIGYFSFNSGVSERIKESENFEVTLRKREITNVQINEDETSAEVTSEEVTEKINLVKFVEENEEIQKIIDSTSKDELYEKLDNNEIEIPSLETKYTRETINTIINEYIGIKNVNKLQEEFKKVLINGIPKEFKESIDEKFIVYAVLIFIGYMVLCESLAVISISKDKNDIQALKTLPISFKKQFEYKVLLPKLLMYSVIGFYIILATLLLQEVMFKLNILLAIIIGILHISVNTTVAALIDLRKPNFNWNTIIEISKNSYNSLILMIFRVILIGLTVYQMITFTNKFNISQTNILLIILVEHALIYLAVELLKKKVVNKWFINI